MFTPKTGTGFPSSASGRALASSSRRRSSVGGLGTPYGGVISRSSTANRSPYITPGNRFASAGSSLLGPQNAFNIESVGSSLPALVMEALTFADKAGEMSVVLSACGWAWLVIGRRLLVWRYTNKEGGSSGPHTPLSSAGGTPVSRSSRHPGSSQTEFRELLLPQSELTHRAQLVVLRQHDSQQMPSCMAVSPEGAVRYWPSIAQESSYTEVTAELQGQECDSLVYLSNSLGYFLATTTSTTLLLMPSPAPHHGVSVRQVKVPAGLLGGLSRRVTSLMFGSLPTQAPEARLVRVVCRSTAASGSVVVLVLSAEYLQCWQLSPGQPDTLLYQSPLLQQCQLALAAKVQCDALAKPSAAIWLLDAQPQPHQPHLLTVLVAAVSTSSAVPGRQQDLIFALANVDTSSCPEAVSHITIVQHGESLSQPHTPSGQDGGGDSSTPPAPLLQYRLVLCNTTAFIYNRAGVVCVPYNDATIALASRLSFSAPGDGLLGAGRLPPPSRGAPSSSTPSSAPIFFSSSQGIVALVSNSATSGAVAQAGLLQCPEEVDSMIMSGATLDTLSSTSSSPAYRLQAAFMIYNRGDFAAAQSILDDLFPEGNFSDLPHACLKLSRNLLDDTPATDPRWAEAGGGGGLVGGAAGSPLSLIITNQIRDKATAHKYYITFLQQTGLWSHLPSPALQSDRVSLSSPCVRAAMLEHVQRLAFAAALRTQHQQHQQLVDQAIGEVIRARGETVTGRLTPADLFYCRITEIHEIVWGLMQAVDEIIAADVVPRDAPASLHTVATLLLALLKAATSVTSATDSSSSSSSWDAVGGTPGREFVPWTATEGNPKGIRTLLIALHTAIVETGLQHAEDAPTKAKLYGTLVNLTDQVLAGYQPQLASLVQPGSTGTALGTPAPAPRFESSFGNVSLKFHRDGLMPSSVLGQQPFVPESATPINHERYQQLLKEYQKQRSGLIQPLVSGGQYSQALSLAEKYCDFRTLVEVCDITQDSGRLDGYMHQFAAQGFSDFVFRWHLETGKRGRLLGYGGGDGGGGEWANELSRFLKGYSGLEWLHQLSTRDFAAAHSTLKEQGLQESIYLARKKTLLSLSKLCRIADGQKQPQDNTGDDMDQSEVCPADPLVIEEDLILYQEQLPEEVLKAHNLDPNTMRVLTPVEMIQLYTGEENHSASEVDFKKALDLLAFVPSLDEAESLKLGIWVRAVLRDVWTNLDTDAPLDAISDTLLFKTIELAFTQGSSLKDLLVPCEELLAQDELQELCKDSGFSFLIKAGYEKIHQLVA